METNGTGGNGANSASTVTEGTKGSIPFDVDFLGGETPNQTPEEIQAGIDAAAKIEADKLAADAAKIEADRIAAAGGGGNDDNESFFEFEGNKLKLNEKGDALNADGTVFKTKEEIDSLSTPALTLIEDVIKLNGVEILDEKGVPKVYEDTEQGIINYMQDVAKQEIVKSQKAFFDSMPQVKEFAQHLLNGGTESDFYKTKTASWKNFELDESNEHQLIDVITKDLVAKGHSKEEAAEYITLFKDSNKLVEKGKAAVESRRKDEDVVNANKQKAEVLEKENYVKEVNKYWGEVNEVVKAGKLEHITIPETDKTAFFNYISKAVDKNGNSQSDLDEANSEITNDLQYKYLRFKKFDLSNLIKNSATTQATKSLRDRITKEKEQTNNGGGHKPNEKGTAADLDNISIDSIK